MKDKIHQLGKNLSLIILPNIGAFITWGLITALFIPTGWLPNAEFAKLIDPMAKYLLPLLIGYSGGRLIYDTRGGVLGAVATLGIIVGTDVPMFAGAMLIGPLAGYLIKKVDGLLNSKIPSGFEMLTNNFSAGLVGLSLTLTAYKLIGPLLTALNRVFAEGLTYILDLGLLPLSAIIIEPAKVLFLNNVINHGVLSPLGFQDAASMGQSILFLLETNPGPGLGVLMAYWFVGSGIRKDAVPGAVLIHFFGGIHEVYFPYVLAKPIVIIALILGNISGIIVFSTLNLGLTATPSPGSIFSILTLAPKGQQMGVLLGVLLSAFVSFVVASFIIGKEKDIEKSTHNLELDSVKKIAFACDAGMGSSAMGASKFNKSINRDDIEVIYCQVDDIPEDVDLVITHKKLMNRVKHHKILGISDFLNDPDINEIIEYLSQKDVPEGKAKMFFKKRSSILQEQNIYTGLASIGKDEAIREAGRLLLEDELIEAEYIDAMIKREAIATTYIGSFVAIPHGTNDSKKYVNDTGIVILQYPDGVDFGDGNTAKLIIGIAASGDEHMDILMKIAEAVSNQETLEFLTSEPNPKKIYEKFVKSGLGGK